MRIDNQFRPTHLAPPWKYHEHIFRSFDYKTGGASGVHVMLYQGHSVHPKGAAFNFPSTWRVQAYAGKQARKYGKMPRFRGSLDFDSLEEATRVALRFIKEPKFRDEFERMEEAKSAEWERKCAEKRKSRNPRPSRRGGARGK